LAQDEASQLDSVSRLAAVPTVNDPKLWMLKCKPGLEKELCISLLQKYFNMIQAGSPINIKSAYTHEGLRGYFYVEAYKADDVKAGCRGIRDLQWFKPVMVPIHEMVETLAVESRAKEVEIGSWARVKRGTYAGDLCKILDKDDDHCRYAALALLLSHSFRHTTLKSPCGAG
jgi:transcription elongation factor SPT5